MKGHFVAGYGWTCKIFYLCILMDFLLYYNVSSNWLYDFFSIVLCKSVRRLCVWPLAWSKHPVVMPCGLNVADVAKVSNEGDYSAAMQVTTSKLGRFNFVVMTDFNTHFVITWNRAVVFSLVTVNNTVCITSEGGHCTLFWCLQ